MTDINWKFIVCASVLAAILLPGALFAQTKYCDIGAVSVPCFSLTAGPAGKATFGTAVMQVIQIALLIVGALSVVFLLWGGFRYITAAGNEEATEAAKQTIQHAIIGLIIVILSFAIITIIANVLIKGTT